MSDRRNKSLPPRRVIAEIERMLDAGAGDDRIARALKITRHDVRKVSAGRSLAPAGSRNAVALYDSACRALAQARTLVEVKDVADKALAIKEYGRLAKDRGLEVNAAELRIRAERRLGAMLATIDLNAGVLRRGNEESSPDQRPRLDELGIDRKLSARAQQLAKISDHVVEARLSQWREAALHDDGRVSYNILKGGPINGHRATAATRVEPDDSLDFFPTPPWATRTLVEVVLRHLDIDGHLGLIWEPACGEGHMSRVLEEYRTEVTASDIFDYGGNLLSDFLGTDSTFTNSSDWIITNPPFKAEMAERFVLRALELAEVGVAMFLRTQWAIEGINRYHTIFLPHPPTLFAPFVERVNLCRGRWDPDGDTLTAYCWLVWLRDRLPMPPFWIPPGQREALTRPDDRARFAAWSMPAAAEAAE